MWGNGSPNRASAPTHETPGRRARTRLGQIGDGAWTGIETANSPYGHEPRVTLFPRTSTAKPFGVPRTTNAAAGEDQPVDRDIA